MSASSPVPSGPVSVPRRASVAPRPPRAQSPARARRHGPLVRLDPGWLFLIAGVGTIAATVLIPAERDLRLARWERDKAKAVEDHRLERVRRYGQFQAALQSGDESVLLSLAATQLTQSPTDRVPLTPIPDPARTSASVFPTLEPPPLREPPHPDMNRRISTLERWTTDDKVRPWLLAGGVLAVLIGVLPTARRS